MTNEELVTALDRAQKVIRLLKNDIRCVSQRLDKLKKDKRAAEKAEVRLPVRRAIGARL